MNVLPDGVVLGHTVNLYDTGLRDWQNDAEHAGNVVCSGLGRRLHRLARICACVGMRPSHVMSLAKLVL